MKANTCEGCLVHDTCCCSGSRKRPNNGCPCKNCLIKMVCETTCEEFEKNTKW